MQFKKAYRCAVIALALPAVLLAARAPKRPRAEPNPARHEYVEVSFTYDCGHTEHELVARDYMLAHPERYAGLSADDGGALHARRAGSCSRHYKLSSGARGVEVLKRDISGGDWRVLMTLPIEYDADPALLYDSLEQIEHALEDWES